MGEDAAAGVDGTLPKGDGATEALGRPAATFGGDGRAGLALAGPVGCAAADDARVPQTDEDRGSAEKELEWPRSWATPTGLGPGDARLVRPLADPLPVGAGAGAGVLAPTDPAPTDPAPFAACVGGGGRAGGRLSTRDTLRARATSVWLVGEKGDARSGRVASESCGGGPGSAASTARVSDDGKEAGCCATLSVDSLVASCCVDRCALDKTEAVDARGCSLRDSPASGLESALESSVSLPRARPMPLPVPSPPVPSPPVPSPPVPSTVKNTSEVRRPFSGECDSRVMCVLTLAA
jgi:hypothetical protein